MIRLRPVAEDDLTALEAMFADPEAIGEFQWIGWTNPHRWRRLWAETGLLGADRSVLMIDVGGERAGFVSWTAIGAGSPFEHLEIGISLWPEFRGHGHGSQAQRQLARYLFSHTTVNRIQAHTEADNLAEQRALEKAGFTREGILRGRYFRAGAYRDEVSYSILRADIVID